jgi:hypothetical protein
MIARLGRQPGSAMSNRPHLQQSLMDEQPACGMLMRSAPGGKLRMSGAGPGSKICSVAKMRSTSQPQAVDLSR